MPADGMHSRHASLRWLLILIVLLAAVPMFLLHAVRLHNAGDAAIEQAYDQARTLTQAGVNEHRLISHQTRQLLEVLSRIPSVRSGALPECEDVLRSVIAGHEWLNGLFVVDADGQGVCGGVPAVRELNIADREYFREAKESLRYEFSGVLTSRLNGERVVVAILPIFDERGLFVRAVGAGINLNWVDRVAANVNKMFGGVFIILDGSGQIVTYQQDAAQPLPLSELQKSIVVQAIREAGAGPLQVTDPLGVQRLFSVARLPGSDITIAVGLDRAEVLRPIEARLWSDLLFLLIVGFCSVSAALLVAEFGLLRGVQALKHAALRLKAGKMGLRVRLPQFVAAELHDLAATYNSMTAEFERLAYLDRLTGLPNRRYLERHVSPRGALSRPDSSVRHAVLAIDIDGFKPVNDNHGHAVGDRVLTLIARRIASAVDDRGLLFRLGGDEFVALLPLNSGLDRDFGRAIAEDIRQAMLQPIELDGMEFPIACSIGIAMVPEDTKSLAEALVVADNALYEAKRNGRNRVVEFAPPLTASLPRSSTTAGRSRGSEAGIAAN